ncbi:acyl-CoA-binding protein [Fulvivirga sp. RKSG066]|uniref:acyl-CoA-binding protein n=1 Tax=Fulvivirga aurantia TaxID=2529383 RepID=UPI0012BB5FA3|nr:acyl-CoA-binding protein [Fulvivirga aurantia]MTI20785.1 acyl-CoA-binding protein [Fulvivirga aurantia]
MEDKFNEAVSRSKQLPSKPSNEELLDLYALYKQSSEGDVVGERPGGFDFKAIAKYDAWSGFKGLSKEEAMEKYIMLVDDLHKKYQ